MVLPWEMVDNSTSLCERISGRFFVMRQSRQAFSSQSETPSELFCGYLHPSPRDMIQHPISLPCLVSEGAIFCRNATGNGNQPWQPAEPPADGRRANCCLSHCQRVPLEKHRSHIGT